MDLRTDQFQAELRRECEELSADIEKIEYELSQCPPLLSREPGFLLTYQEHKLKAELQLLREQPPESLVRTSIMPVVVAILLDELKRVNSQLEESLVAIQQKTRDSEAKRERLSHYLDDFQKIHAHLMARHSEAEQSAMNTLSRSYFYNTCMLCCDTFSGVQHDSYHVNVHDHVLVRCFQLCVVSCGVSQMRMTLGLLFRDQQAIAKKRRKAKEYYTSLSEEMETFISQHFGSPGEEETELETEKSRRKKVSTVCVRFINEPCIIIVFIKLGNAKQF
jgi:hypothetical protein